MVKIWSNWSKLAKISQNCSTLNQIVSNGSKWLQMALIGSKVNKVVTKLAKLAKTNKHQNKQTPPKQIIYLYIYIYSLNFIFLNVKKLQSVLLFDQNWYILIQMSPNWFK